MLNFRLFRLAWLLAALLLVMVPAFPVAAQTGSWTATASASDALETALLLTDGSVIIHSYGNYTTWFKLTPDAQGNYANSAFTQIASNTLGRLYGQTAVLRDGRVFYGGGEYLTGTSDHNTCEVYDPVANVWTAGPDSLYSDLGDTGSAILPDGRLLCSNWNNDNTDIYDPAANAWTNAAAMTSFTGDEETWTSLADGTVLSTFFIGQRYIPAQNAWVPTGTIPVSLVDSKYEMGPVLELYDGRVLALGGTGHTAFFTLPATQSGAGSWVAGPDMPSGLSAPDTPACVEVNGKVLCVGTPTDFGATSFLEFDPAADSFSSVPSPAGFAQDSDGVRLLALPNGQILMTAGYNNAWIYTPAGGPQAGWAPAVASVAANAGGSYTVSGTQLNGLTNGGAYGDEANPYTHYPIVYLVDGSGAVHFARTFNFSQMNPSLPGARQTADFTLPAGLANGAYSLHVSASGISSAAFPFQVGPSGPAAGAYRITPQNRPDLALDVQGFANADNTVVQLWYANYGAGQQWFLDPQTDGSYIIRAFGGQNSTQVLDDSGGGTGNGNPVRTYHDNGLTPQRWDITANGGGWCRIIPVAATGQTLDMSGGQSAGPGAAANLYQFYGGGNQLFRFDSATPPALQISNVAVSAVTTSGATVTWTTNVTADDAVDYGLTASYGSAATGSGSRGSTDNHSVALSGLTPGALYHFRVRSTDLNNRTATSADATFTVLKTATTLTVSTVSGSAGQTVTLAAVLKKTSDGTAIVGKTVTFKVDSAVVGTAPTQASGTARFSYAIPGNAAAGSHPLSDSFAGDSAYNAAGGTGTLTVKAATTLTVTAVSGTRGATVTLAAVLRKTSDGTAIAGKTITFKVDGAVVGTARTQASGTARFSYVIPTNATIGSHPTTGSFAGDSSYNASSGTGTLTVH